MATWRHKSYEELPALSVRRGELRRSLRTVTAAYLFAIVFIACCSGAHVMVYCRMLGFTDFHMGLLQAVPYVATLGQLLAAILVERTGLKKFQFIDFATFSRAMWILLALLPLVLPIPSALAVYGVLMVLLASSLAGALSGPAWYTWMGDLIPKRIRGRYWGYRARMGSLVQIPVVVGLGLLMDYVTVPGAPDDARIQRAFLWATCAVFAAGSLLGVTDILLFYRIRDVLPSGAVPRERPPARKGPSIREMLLDPLRDRVFRNYVLYGATITFAVGVSSVFFWLQAMEVLGFSKLAANVLFLVIPPVMGLAAAPWWGKIIDRWGRRPVLILATIGTMISMIPWLFLSRQTPAPGFLVGGWNRLSGRLGELFGQPGWAGIGPGVPVGAYLLACLAAVIGGTAWAGVTMAQEGVVLGFSDSKGRSRHVAACAVLLGIGGALGGVIGGVVASGLQDLHRAPIGPFLWNNWHAVMLLSLLVRIPGVLFLIRMPEPGSKQVRDVVRILRTNVFNALNPRLFYRLRILVWGRRGRTGPPNRRRGEP